MVNNKDGMAVLGKGIKILNVRQNMKTLSPEPIPTALKNLYGAQAMLKSAFSEWPFSLDGNLIGDIGEVIALKVFKLSRLPRGKATHDLQAPDGKLVQVKATQKNKSYKIVGLGLKKETFDHLLVFELDQEGFYEILYNGPGSYIDKARKHKTSASLSRKQLRELQLGVSEHEKLKPV